MDLTSSPAIRRQWALALTVFLGIGGSAAWGQQPFFPGAEGFGAFPTGSAPTGGWFADATIYHVTRTDDVLGPNNKAADGTLRRAFLDDDYKQQGGNVIVVFDVGGTFELNPALGKIDIKNISNYYIAGQTAPSPVTVYGNLTQIGASNDKLTSNIILRYMSFRKGTGDGDDAITFKNGNATSGDTNMILDHVSASWSEDEVLSVANFNTNITVQYSMITDSLSSFVTNGHQYGSLIRPEIDSQVSFHHNLYGNDRSRNPRPGTYDGKHLDLDFRNNVIYNWSDRAGYSGGGSESDTEFINIDYVGNYAIAGPATPVGQKSETLYTMDVSSYWDLQTNSANGNNKDFLAIQIYQSGNYIDSNHDPNRDGSDTGWDMFIASDGDVTAPYPDFNYAPNGSVAAKLATSNNYAPVTTQSAPDAYNSVIDHVGNWWWNRDVIDERIIGNVVNNTQPAGGIPATAPVPSELTYVQTSPETSHPTNWDSDDDGMPDYWETAHGLNPNSDVDAVTYNAGNPSQNDFDLDGYTNLQEYLDEIGAFPAPTSIDFNGATNNRYAQITNWKTNDGGITTGTNWQPSRFDTARIHNGAVVVDAVGQHAGTLQVGPDAGNNATLNVTGGWIDVNDNLQVGSASGAGALAISSGATVYATVVAVGPMGTVQGNGEIVGDVFNAGLVTPGTSVGTLTIDGDVMQDSAGILLMEIDSLASYDQFNITGTFFAGGTLDIDLNYSPSEGDSFDLLDFDSAMGSWFVDLPPLDPGLVWDTDDLLITGTLSVVAGVPMDNANFDGDDDVDGDDFLIWQRNFNSAGGLTQGDANGSGFVDSADLAIWEDQYGMTGLLTAVSTTVPEPNTALLLLLSTTCLMVRRLG